MLIDEFYESCELLNEVRRPDGEGGFYTSYEVAGEFQAAIVNDSSTLAMIAEKQGVTSTYTITTNEAVILKYPDIIRRIEDGQSFRITSNSTDTKAPKSSTIRIRQVKAERWELTND